jgi:hypothetical protein
VEDRWHRNPKCGEQVAWPADNPRPGAWCTDPRHGEPGTLVMSARHRHGLRWLARWVDHDGNERSKAFDRKADAQRHITDVTTALSTGSYTRPQAGSRHIRHSRRTMVRLQERTQAQDPRRVPVPARCRGASPVG